MIPDAQETPQRRRRQGRNLAIPACPARAQIKAGDEAAMRIVSPRGSLAAALALALSIAAALLLLAPAASGTPSAPPLAPAERQADRLVVYKAARRLQLLRDDAVIADYRIALGFDPIGHKQREGDGRTPEGLYRITWRNPESAFHLSLFVNYPNQADRAAAAARGDDPGGEIFIHGGSRAPSWLGWIIRLFRGNDWTAGCIAVTNNEMDEIWALTPNGVPIDIRP